MRLLRNSHCCIKLAVCDAAYGAGFGILLKAAMKFGGIVIETAFSEKNSFTFLLVCIIVNVMWKRLHIVKDYMCSLSNVF